MRLKPERLNLAIARRCHVSCSGCYTYFGAREPDLSAFVSSAAAFVALGIDHATISGGDPLTLDDLLLFTDALRRVGVRSIKVDTVGVGLAPGTTGPTIRRWGLAELLGAVDFLGVPLDGWSNESVLHFRRGRAALYSETVALLDALDRSCATPKVIINTVVHRDNARDLYRIGTQVLGHPAVCHWNLFQHTPTDQAQPGANTRFCIEDTEFERASVRLQAILAARPGAQPAPAIRFHSNRDRLGQYLMINSDGDAWFPDENGRTVPLGNVLGAERRVLALWRERVKRMLDRVRDREACHTIETGD